MKPMSLDQKIMSTALILVLAASSQVPWEADHGVIHLSSTTSNAPGATPAQPEPQRQQGGPAGPQQAATPAAPAAPAATPAAPATAGGGANGLQVQPVAAQAPTGSGGGDRPTSGIQVRDLESGQQTFRFLQPAGRPGTVEVLTFTRPTEGQTCLDVSCAERIQRFTFGDLAAASRETLMALVNANATQATQPEQGPVRRGGGNADVLNLAQRCRATGLQVLRCYADTIKELDGVQNLCEARPSSRQDRNGRGEDRSEARRADTERLRTFFGEMNRRVRSALQASVNRRDSGDAESAARDLAAAIRDSRVEVRCDIRIDSDLLAYLEEGFPRSLEARRLAQSRQAELRELARDYSRVLGDVQRCQVQQQRQQQAMLRNPRMLMDQGFDDPWSNGIGRTSFGRDFTSGWSSGFGLGAIDCDQVVNRLSDVESRRTDMMSELNEAFSSRGEIGSFRTEIRDFMADNPRAFTQMELNQMLQPMTQLERMAASFEQQVQRQVRGLAGGQNPFARGRMNGLGMAGLDDGMGFSSPWMNQGGIYNRNFPVNRGFSSWGAGGGMGWANNRGFSGGGWGMGNPGWNQAGWGGNARWGQAPFRQASWTGGPMYGNRMGGGGMGTF